MQMTELHSVSNKGSPTLSTAARRTIIRF